MGRSSCSSDGTGGDNVERYGHHSMKLVAQLPLEVTYVQPVVASRSFKDMRLLTA
jgi:hypothetical protein